MARATRSRVGSVLAAAALAGGVAAGTLATPVGANPRGTTPVSAATQIRRSWETFFRGSTPPARKIALVQDGARFAAVIRAQASSPLARSTTAKVSRVRVRSTTRATVTYTIYLGGKPALQNRTGTSLYLARTWKVSAASFCQLLALEQVKVPLCK